MTDNPYAASSQELKAINADIEADFDKFLANSEPLTDADLVLTGTLVQLFNYADLNARRAIDAIRHAALGPNQQNAGKLQDSQVYPKLIEAAEMLPVGSDLRNGLIKLAKAMQLHQPLRHHAAHWAMRRVPGHDVLLMLTYNSQEGKRRSGQATDPYHVTFGLLPMSPLRAESKLQSDYGEWLSVEAAKLYVEFAAWKKHFEDEKAAAKAGKIAEAKATGKADQNPRT
jgi:hypothetical protein